ncbi:YqaA family protein [Azospirillum sp. SYSU D00513]|uniref:YqaA family protein n=1 Tax=Azospirillum sp. SYSU D00513 TaxID=2812561 RepID=UPI001A9661B1|nr:YqaA family protein [Azospirillum sp. SYSU D00513]
MMDIAAYGGLFLTALLAATVLPAQSEILLAGMHASGKYDVAALVLVATAGNVLGSACNWAIGRYLMHFQDRRWFPIRPALVERATRWYNRFGLWSLLLAWAPFIGDPLTLVAGILRVDFRVFLLLVTVGKAARYAALVAVL